jgi:uridine kinase
MPFDFDEIHGRMRSDLRGFIEECDAEYGEKVSGAARRIAETAEKSPIVLLSGPSGSGKTTTAKKIEQELEAMGIGTYAISMDNYFITVNEDTHPRDEQGNIDFESPECMDMELLVEHFHALASGREIMLPKFEFANQRRNPDRAVPLRLGKNEVAIFEGIHALSDAITDNLHGEAVKVYISARSNVEKGGVPVFMGTWMRFLRRMTRDSKFRSCPPEQTMRMWASVRRGEKKYISPYKNKGDVILDSALAYEVGVMRGASFHMLGNIPDCERAAEFERLREKILLFDSVPESLVAPDSLLREFLGGGSYSY